MDNYKAFIAMIDRVEPIPGADRIHTAYVLGHQVVVTKYWDAGTVGVFFPADCQLSEDFCKHNNLYRHSQYNVDPEAKGFFEDNRRVRCQPFLKVRSEGFFTDVNALLNIPEVTVQDVLALDLGDSFDELGGVEICRKYINPRTKQKQQSGGQKAKKKIKEIDAPEFYKHVDTNQFALYSGKIEPGALLSFHAKVHGTSARVGYVPVKRLKKGWWNTLKRWLGIGDPYETNYEYVVGTRNVAMFEEQSDKEGFHGSEQFRFDVAEKLKPYLEKGMIVYGEIAGYANGSPIMGTHSTEALKNKAFKKKYGKEMVYSYGCKPDEYRFHIYRIIDLDFAGEDYFEWPQHIVENWCVIHGFNPPVEVYESFVYDGDKQKLEELVSELTERPDVLTEDYIDPSHVSEGIIIRVDHEDYGTQFYKSKSYAFKVMEGIFKEDNVDLEDAS